MFARARGACLSLLGLAVGLLGLWAIAFAGSAEAQPPGCSLSGDTVTCTFSSTGEHSFVVPDGVSTIHVVAVGGAGGVGRGTPPSNPGGAGGSGDRVVGDLAVAGDTTLYVEVGGNGSPSTGQTDLLSCTGNFTGGAGGSNGGANGGSRWGGGGGGASDIRTVPESQTGTLASRELVAGGGGGGGGCRGGRGGNARSAGANAAAGGGGAGTQSAPGGVGGTGNGGGAAGTQGVFGSGGAGGTGPTTSGDGGGGGGGGYYGGGGGGRNNSIGAFGGGGGGGGSSFTARLTDSSVATATTGTPEVEISYTEPAPAQHVVLTKKASRAVVRPGEELSYTIKVHNPASDHQFSGEVTDDLSGVLDKATYLDDAHVLPPGTGSVEVNTSTKKLTWHGTLDPGNDVTIHYSVKVHDGAEGDLFNGVNGPEGSTCKKGDPLPPCMTVTPIEPPPASGPNLKLTKTASTDTLHPGGQVTYTLVVLNRGPGEATGVRLEDPSPSGLVFHQADPSQGHCTINRVLHCALGDLHADGEALIELTATAAADASGTIVNKATVWGNQGDPNESNDTATSTVHVTPPPEPPTEPGEPPEPPTEPTEPGQPPTEPTAPGAQPVSNLVVTKHVNHHTGLRGHRLRYTITVTNKGPDPAAGLKLTDTPSLPLRVLSIHAGHGHCRTGPPIKCMLGTLRAGAHITITIIAVTTVAGAQVNTTAVMSESRDPHPRGNVAAAKTRILAAPRRPRPPARPPAPPPFTG